MFEAVRYCCMHNKCMKLHTEITFSKLAYPRCDPHVIGWPVPGSKIVVQSFSKKGCENTSGGWGETGPPFFPPRSPPQTPRALFSHTDQSSACPRARTPRQLGEYVRKYNLSDRMGHFLSALSFVLCDMHTWFHLLHTHSRSY